MKKQNGITLISLTITIIVMLIIAGITINFSMDLVRKAKLQDLKTNMLLIQAKAKEYVEEVSFQTANMDSSKPEDLEKINAIKSENLKGQKISTNPEIQQLATNTGKIDSSIIDEYYYFDEGQLVEMGIEKLNLEEQGYFIVRYNIEDIKVEVINTKGYEGNYTLEEISSIIEE